MKKTSPILVFTFLFVAFSQSILAQSTFYIRHGNDVQKVVNQDPNKLKVREWQVWLYRNGKPTSGNNRWGVISAKTAGEVMTKLKKEQDFELKYNEWAGKGRVHDDVLTNFNPLGPIAILEDERPGSSQGGNSAVSNETAKRILDAYKEVEQYYNNYMFVRDRILDPKEATPFDNVGNVFKEYADNLAEAFTRANELRRMLDSHTSVATDQITQQLAEIQRNMDIVRTNTSSLSQQLNNIQFYSPQDDQAVNKVNSGQGAVDLDRFSEELMDVYANMDPSNPEAALASVKRLCREMADEILSDPDSDATMKRLANLLKRMSETDDAADMANYLQEMTDLLTEIGN